MKTKFLPIINILFLLSTVISNRVFATEFSREVCQRCHDQNGQDFLPTVPVLKGQNTAYLMQQFDKFNQGNRQHPQLNSEAFKKTNTAQVKTLADYFSGFATKTSDQQPKENSSPRLDMHSYSFVERIKQGESLYSSCTGCHGEHAEGISPYPRLADQRAEYLERQLSNFKSGARKSVIMQMITVNLSDKEINALAMYLSTINDKKVQARRQ